MPTRQTASRPLAPRSVVTSSRPARSRRPGTVRDALHWARGVLAATPPGTTDTPALDADVLLRHVLDWDRATLVLRDHEPFAETSWRRYRAAVARRARAEPVAYITGTKEFAGVPFRVDRRVLVPRPDTEILVDVAVARLAPRGHAGRAVDVGTGSGAIAIALASACPLALVHAVDIDPGALRVARANSRRLALGARLRFHLGDGLGSLRTRVDVACANLPYIPSGDLALLDPTVRDWEPRLALDGGQDGLDPYRSLLRDTPSALRAGSSVLMECDPAQVPALVDLALAAHPRASVTVHRDLAGRDRVVEARLPD